MLKTCYRCRGSGIVPSINEYEIDKCPECEDGMIEEDVKPKTLFFVTTAISNRDSWKDDRTHGCSETFKEAEDAILQNVGDMHECSNDYAVIEEQTMTVCSMTKRFSGGVYQWYHWNDAKEQYERCNTPAWAENVCNWGIG